MVYEDGSHFSRDSKRHFGEPPLRDVQRLRESAAALSKLATARELSDDAQLAALLEELGLGSVASDQLYAALDWLYLEQPKIEQRLAREHLHDGCLVLYDVSSTHFEGRACPLAAHGHSRDGKKDKQQIVFGLLCNREGGPIAVEVFAGNTADPKTRRSQIAKVRKRFGLERVVFVGDRGASHAPNPPARSASSACSSRCSMRGGLSR